MVQTPVSWSERKRLTPSTYVWKGRLLTCVRWMLASRDQRLACEIEYNGRGCTVDFYHRNPDGHGTILAFSSVGNYDLRCRRIYADSADDCQADVLAWVNDWRPPVGGVDGGILLCMDEWGNEVAV
ncbi:MAG: hypothetical protein J6S63_09310 [Atopobiaceae bacterium]|nr:hypothetical protein [Atopobiaceae bacterium]